MGRGRTGGRRHERPHKPHELGPRIFARGRWLAADLRPWGGGRPTLRNPRHRDWPDDGERLEDTPENREIAARWVWAYVDAARDGVRRRIRGERPPGRPLSEATDAWLRHRERSVEDNTYRSNAAVVGHLLSYFGDDAIVERITTGDLQGMFDAMLDDGYAPSTLNTEKYILSAFFKWAGVEPNPVRGVELPDVARDEVVAWIDDEIEALRRAADLVDRARHPEPPSARLALELALATGARQQELFALQWEDLDAEEKTVRIRRQLTRHGGRTKPLKGKEIRTALVLPSWWAWHRSDASGLILAGPDGRAVRYRSSWLLGQRILDTANLNAPGLGWHSFRHTYARIFLEGVRGDIGLLQKSLGHKSIRTTESYYGHFYSPTAARLARAAIYGEPVLKLLD